MKRMDGWMISGVGHNISLDRTIRRKLTDTPVVPYLRS